MNITEGMTIGDILNQARKDKGLTVNELANRSKTVEATVKNILTNKTLYPRRDTLEPIAEVLNLPIEELMNHMNESVKNNAGVRSCSNCISAEHYERHIADLKASAEKMEQHYERRLADKREVIAEMEKHIDTIKLDKRFFRIGFFIVLTVFLTALIGLSIAELMHPQHGWLRY